MRIPATDGLRPGGDGPAEGRFGVDGGPRTPDAGLWRRPAGDGPFRLSLEASRRAADGADAANGVGIRIETSW